MPTQRLRLASLLLVVLFTSSAGVQTPAPARILAEADRLAWLSNWQRAGSLYARAEQVSVQAGDQRDKLYAECGRLRAEMDAGSWAKISSEVATVFGNPIVQNDRRLMLRCVATKGDLDREDDPQSARAAWEKALDLAKSLGDSGWQSRAKAELALIHFMDGEPEEAHGLLKEAMISAFLHFDRPTLVIYGAMICAGDTEIGKADEALGYCDKALKLAATIKDMGYPFQAYGAKARALTQLGRQSEAQRLLDATLVQTKQLDMRLEESQTLILLGRNSEAMGDFPQAIRYFEQAGELSRANGFEHSIAWSMFEAAEAYRAVGERGRRMRRFIRG
jgi:tetratricopeptide (TPR) repeat protein